jgi:hypothetical protein
MADELPRTVPDEIDIHRIIWVKLNRRWRAIHYALGIAATICSITVAWQPPFLLTLPSVLPVLAWISALCISLATFFVPIRKAKGYVSAARILTDACNRYKFDHDYDIRELLNAVKLGEDLISRSEEL